MNQLSDIIKALEDRGLIDQIKICRNYDTGEPELHIWFNKPNDAYEIITEAKVSGINEANCCPYWE